MLPTKEMKSEVKKMTTFKLQEEDGIHLQGEGDGRRKGIKHEKPMFKDKKRKKMVV